jgi:hypothetical protein
MNGRVGAGRIRRVSGLAVVASTAVLAGSVPTAGAVTLPPNPCVTSALRCVLEDLPPVHLPVVHNPTAPCDATCGISPRHDTVRRG